MKPIIGFQLYALKDYEGGWEAAFEAVKDMGIDNIEAWCGVVPSGEGGELNEADGMSIADFRDVLIRYDMKLTNGHLSVAEYDSHYKEWRDLLKDFGSKDWVIPFENAQTLDEWLALIPKYKVMSERLAGDGLSLGYHNHGMELVEMDGKYVMHHLLDNLPSLKAQFHIGQFTKEKGISLPAWIRQYEGRVCSLHINDCNAEGETRLGAGTCEAEASVKAAMETGVAAYIVEIMLTKDSQEGIVRDVEQLRKWLGE